MIPLERCPLSARPVDVGRVLPDGVLVDGCPCCGRSVGTAVVDGERRVFVHWRPCAHALTSPVDQLPDGRMVHECLTCHEMVTPRMDRPSAAGCRL